MNFLLLNQSTTFPIHFCPLQPSKTRRHLPPYLLIPSSMAYALEDTSFNRLTQAERYLGVTPPKDLFQDAAEQMAMNFDPSQRQAFKDLITKHLDIEALTKTMKDTMVRHFTADELKALADFYGSVEGKSSMKKFGAYMADVMPSVKAEMVKAIAKANREVADIEEK